MATWTITRTLDVSPSPVPTVIHIKQYASDFALVFNLKSSDGSFTIAGGASVYIRGTKMDGRGWQLQGSRSGNTVTFSGTHDQMQQMTAVAGKNVFEVVIINGTKELPFATFVLDVQRAAMDSGTVNPSQIDELKGQIIENTTVEYGGDNVTVENGVLIIS